MLKKYISLLLSAVIISSLSIIPISVSGDELDGNIADENIEDTNIYNEFDQNSEDIESFFPEYENEWWSIPEYDKTGMSEFDIIKKNMYYTYLRELGNIDSVDATVREALSLYQDDGSFPGLDYWSYEVAALPMARHFRYLRNMIVAYQSPESAYYQDKDVYDKVIKALDFYANTVTRRYEKGKYMGTWWRCTIGHSLAIMPFLCVAYEIIPQEYIERYCNQFLYEPKQMDKAYVTGTNGVWYAQQAVVKGVLLEKEDIVEEGIEVIRNMAKLQDVQFLTMGMDPFSPSNEGLQTDNSFHQHGPKYYFNYSGLFGDFTNISTYLQGTKYEMSDLYDGIIDGIIDGWVWTSHYNLEDINQYGRVLCSPATLAGAIITPDTKFDRSIFCNILYKLSKLCPKRADECLKYAKYFLETDNEESQKLVGDKYFYRSDYLCHQREGWTLFNQMNSRRSNGAEYSTVDQIKAYWIGFGNTFLYKGKDPYYGSYMGQPVYWDWARIPGTTASEYLHEYLFSGYFTHQKELFAGGVSDGQYGMSAMKLTDRAGVSAKKSWFCFDDEFVSLGSGITASSNTNVSTNIEQRRLYGDVEVNGGKVAKGTNNYNNVSTVLHYGIGYVFPEGEDIVIRNDKQFGSYADATRMTEIDRTVYSMDMFTMWIPHGMTPSNDKYCYITIPETDSESLKQYSENISVNIVSNTEKLQAVYHRKLDIGGAVFYENGTVDFGNGFTIKTDGICCVMTRIKNGKLQISVSNPYAKKTDINLEITYKGQKYNMEFNLPGVDKDAHDYGGKSVMKEIDA